MRACEGHSIYIHEWGICSSGWAGPVTRDPEPGTLLSHTGGAASQTIQAPTGQNVNYSPSPNLHTHTPHVLDLSISFPFI